ncbi:MAG: hypothetical protein U0R51_09340 [Solirubrobacterales bacterium]
MGRGTGIVVAGIVVMVVGCGSSETTTQPAVKTDKTVSNDQTKLSGRSPGERADAYARQLSGVTEPCASTATGDRPGCIYLAAYSGCYAGIKGEWASAGVRTQFEQPKLARTYRRARSDCFQPGPAGPSK